MSADITLVNMAADPVRGERVMPLGALHLTAALEREGYGVDLRDVQLAEAPTDTVEGLADFFDTEAPVLGISLMSDRMASTVFALREVRARRPELTIVVGGAGPTEVAGPLLEAFDHIDAVARGEGEETLVAAMRALRESGQGALAGIGGLSTRVEDRVVHGPDRPRLRDVDSLAYPGGCRNDITPYQDVSLMTARGCPFRCSFCSIVALWGQRMSYRTVDSVAEEIAWLMEQRPGAFIHLEDDTFTVSRKRVVAFCDALDRRGLEVEWGCTGRVDMVDEALVARMAASGCRSMFLGIESGSDRLRAQVLKGFTSRDVFERVETLLKHVQVTAHYIWGYPSETLDDFYETLLHVGYLEAMGAQPRHSHFVPFPRAPLVQAYDGPLHFRTSYPFPRLFTLDPAAPWLGEVQAQPEVFLPYFSVHTPHEEEKFDVVAELGRVERAR